MHALALSALALGAGARTALAQADEAVECRGEAAVEGDAAVAKDRAYKNALRDCVERKLGTFVSAASQTKDFQALQDVVLTSAQGFVTEAKELESGEKDGVYFVRLKAKVAEAKIDAEAKARHLTLQSMKHPRIALAITEQFANKEGVASKGLADQKLAENAIISAWKAAGPYQFVELGVASGKLGGDASADKVKELGGKIEADVVIVGTALSNVAGNGSIFGGAGSDQNGSNIKDMIFCKSTLSLRAFSPDSGEVLAAIEVTASPGKVTLGEVQCHRAGLLAAGSAAAVKMEKELLKAWNQRIFGQGRVKLKVKGLDFDGVRSLRGLLGANIKAISQVTQRGYSDGVADFDLSVEGGDVEALADALSACKPLAKLKLKLTGLSGNTITLEAK